MTDNLSPEDRKRTMRAVKSKSTGPERRFRSMLAGLGIQGWRLNYQDAPGKPDFAFPDHKIAVFVDGCFWHQCPACDRPLPVTNHAYWRRKINRNVERDKYNMQELTTAGWRVLRIWEHEIRKGSDLRPIADKLQSILDSQYQN